MIIRCQSFCEHDNQCGLEAGHSALVHQHIGCGCVGSQRFERPSWDRYFMASARLAATRSTCDRKRVGAVLVSGKRIIATGYNGAPSGSPDCIEVNHQMVTYADGASSCVRTIHAEQNAIIQCAIVGVSTVGSVLYNTASPCLECLKAIIQAGISAVVFAEPYTGGRLYGADLEAIARAASVEWRQILG